MLRLRPRKLLRRPLQVVFQRLRKPGGQVSSRVCPMQAQGRYTGTDRVLGGGEGHGEIRMSSVTPQASVPASCRQGCTHRMPAGLLSASTRKSRIYPLWAFQVVLRVAMFSVARTVTFRHACVCRTAVEAVVVSPAVPDQRPPAVPFAGAARQPGGATVPSDAAPSSGPPQAAADPLRLAARRRLGHGAQRLDPGRRPAECLRRCGSAGAPCRSPGAAGRVPAGPPVPAACAGAGVAFFTVAWLALTGTETVHGMAGSAAAQVRSSSSGRVRVSCFTVAGEQETTWVLGIPQECVGLGVGSERTRLGATCGSGSGQDVPRHCVRR